MNSEAQFDSSYDFSFREMEVGDKDYFLSGIKSVSEATYFQCEILKKGQLKLEIQVALLPDGSAVSLPNAPFGGFWVYDDVNSEVFASFLNSWVFFLKEKGAKEIKITQAPCTYMSHSDWVEYFLQKQGFELIHIFNHQFLEGKKRLKTELKTLLSKYSKKVKDNNLKVSVGNIQSFNFLNQIKSWNQSRGYSVSFDENQLIAQVSTYPERYFVLSVMQEAVPVGHALAVKLTSNSVYYFLSAIDPKAKVKIIGELIMVHLLKLAVEQKASFLDLSSSEVEGEPNHSLMFFKSKFANCSHNKMVWRLML